MDLDIFMFGQLQADTGTQQNSLFHQSPTRHSDYIVTTTVTM